MTAAISQEWRISLSASVLSSGVNMKS